MQCLLLRGYEKQSTSQVEKGTPGPVRAKTSTFHLPSSKIGIVTSLLAHKRKNLAEASVDISRSAQIRDIEASFDACATNFDLSALKHPNKPNVTAVSSYEIFPNVEIWANTYDLFKFSERPGERAPDVRVFKFDSRCDSGPKLMRLFFSG